MLSLALASVISVESLDIGPKCRKRKRVNIVDYRENK